MYCSLTTLSVPCYPFLLAFLAAKRRSRKSSPVLPAPSPPSASPASVVTMDMDHGASSSPSAAPSSSSIASSSQAATVASSPSRRPPSSRILTPAEREAAIDRRLDEDEWEQMVDDQKRGDSGAEESGVGVCDDSFCWSFSSVECSSLCFCFAAFLVSGAH